MLAVLGKMKESALAEAIDNRPGQQLKSGDFAGFGGAEGDTAGAIAAAVLLAIAGGLIAGAFGGWRAARLRPAMALARVQ